MAEDKDNKAAADAAAESAAKARKAAETRLSEQRKQSEQDTKDQLARISGTQPTPTQEENDRAKLGLATLEELDNKEADGSPEVDETAPRSTSTESGGAAYQNRATQTKSPGK